MQPPERELSELKELKVRIPIAYHVHLHSLKVLTGKPISEAVQEALAHYFADQRPFHPPELFLEDAAGPADPPDDVSAAGS